MHAAQPEDGRWPDPTSLHDGPRGVVARIVDPPSGRPLVVKRLQVDEGQVASVALRLVAVGMVDHPNVGSVRGLWPVDGAIEVVRDDRPDDWSAFVDEAPPWEVLRDRFVELLDGLAAIHAEGWVHGALRPTNVRWDGAGPLQLVDGGWPRESRPRGHREARGDLWDAGALLWAAITGHTLHFGDPLPRFEPRMACPAAVGTLLCNLLHDEPLARYDLAADVLAIAPGGVDHVVEVAPAQNAALDVAVLANHGSIAYYANNNGDEFTAPIMASFAKNARWQGLLLYTVGPEALAVAAEDITAALEAGALPVGADAGLPLTWFPLEDTAAAHDAVEQGVTGKVLIRVADDLR